MDYKIGAVRDEPNAAVDGDYHSSDKKIGDIREEPKADHKARPEECLLAEVDDDEQDKCKTIHIYVEDLDRSKGIEAETQRQQAEPWNQSEHDEGDNSQRGDQQQPAVTVAIQEGPKEEEEEEYYYEEEEYYEEDEEEEEETFEEYSERLRSYRRQDQLDHEERQLEFLEEGHPIVQRILYIRRLREYFEAVQDLPLGTQQDRRAVEMALYDTLQQDDEAAERRRSKHRE